VAGIVASVRRTLTLLLAVTSAIVLVVATATAATEPIVSPKADPYYRFGGLKDTKGFGRVKPHEIYYGGTRPGSSAISNGMAGAGESLAVPAWDGSSGVTSQLTRDILRSRPSSRPSSGVGRASQRTTG
jgi:hypothetical protein